MQVRRVLAALLVTALGLGVAVVAAPPSGAAFPRAQLGPPVFERLHVFDGERVRVSYAVFHDDTQTITCGIAWGDGLTSEFPPVSTVDSTGARDKESTCKAGHDYTDAPDPLPPFGAQAGVPGGDYLFIADATDQDDTSARGSRRRYVVVCHNSRPFAGETAWGGTANDTLCGTSRPDRLRGNGGRDVIRGFAGDDWILGGGGSDGLVGGGGADAIRSGPGEDVAIGHDGSDLLIGDDGHDLLFGGAGDDHLLGNRLPDFVLDFNGMDRLFAGGGDDLIVTCDLPGSGKKPDLVRGSTGDDVASVDDNDDVAGVEDPDDCGGFSSSSGAARSAPIPRSMRARFLHLLRT